MSRVILLLVTAVVLSACQATAPELRATTMEADTPSAPKTHIFVPRY